MYMQQGSTAGAAQGSSSSYGHGQGDQYTFAFDPGYAGVGGSANVNAGPSSSSESDQNRSYDYSFARTPQTQSQSQAQGQDPIPVNVDTVHTAFQGMTEPPSPWGAYGGGGGQAGSTSEERSTSRQWAPQPLHQQQPQGGYVAGRGGSGSGSSPYPYGSTPDPWSRDKAVTTSQWPDTYAGPSAPASAPAPERELNGLQLTLNELVESIRPYAASPSNPRPPPPPPYLQARFIRLASTVQSSLSSLQPHAHPHLHPQFTRQPPTRRHASGKSALGVGGTTESPSGMTAAEKEMEVIRKRRDMLIARAAQVQASSHPAAVHHSQLPANWNHGELYQNGGGIYSSSSIGNGNGNGGPTSSFTSNSFPTDTAGAGAGASASLSSSRRSTITIENFDASLARFSLDPTKIGQGQTINNIGFGNNPNPNHPNANANANDSNGNGLSHGQGQGQGYGHGNGGFVFEPKQNHAPEGGRCHGCGASATPEWRMGPDGPRSLCNACGLHYAKITRRRAQDQANGGNGDGITNGAGGNQFPPSMIVTSNGLP